MKILRTNENKLRYEAHRASVRTLAAVLLCAASLCLCGSFLTGCSADRNTWAVYLYMCGSDLESKWGSASNDLAEIVPEEMPEHLTFVVETGGTKEWQDERFDAAALQRWEITTDGFQLVDQQPQACMSDEQTFRDFLEFCRKKYPAEHTMILLWDHGAGTLYGACRDTNFPDNGMLNLTEMHSAVYDAFGEHAVDILGFDCCLMATADVADLFSDTCDYLIASEESVPSEGWSYGGIVNAIAKDENITPKKLGEQIINDFKASCIDAEDYETRTLSLTDLSRIDAVTEALDRMGDEILRELYASPQMTAVDLSLYAGSSVNYGGNSRVQGYQNLVDLKDLAELMKEEYPAASEVIKAVDRAVVAETAGKYRSGSGGLSVFYPFDGKRDDVRLYSLYGRSMALKCIYGISVRGALSEQEQAYVESLGLDGEKLPEVQDFTGCGFRWDGAVKKNDAGNYYVSLGKTVADCVTNAMVELYQEQPDGSLLWLGSNDEIHSDFDNGIFENDFSGTWLHLGENVASAELVDDGYETNLYAIPIMLQEDNSPYALQVVKDRETKEWHEIGIREGNSEPGEARSRPLADGTEIFMIRQISDASWNESSEYVAVTYANALLHYDKLPDGTYRMCFKFEDLHKNSMESQFFTFRVRNGNVIYED